MAIDVHAHIWTDAYLDLVQAYGKTDTATQRGLGAGTSDADIEARFALMDEAGIAQQVLSVAPQSPHFTDRDHAVRAARTANDLYAEVVRRWPDRFRAFAALPFPHTDAALEELRRALDDLGMVGACTTTSVLGRSVADPAFEPVFEELDRRGSVLHVHPAGTGAESPLIAGHRLTWSIGAPVEDTVAAMHLVLAGVPSRLPRMKIVLSHLGGALPMVLSRADRQYAWEAPDIPEKPSAAARRMWYDTVGHGHVPALWAAVESLGADRLLLGTDFPYQAGGEFLAATGYIRHSGLPEEQVAAILDGNVAGVIPA
ncbi:amidohydrolase family protein [Streptomyces sp. VNUA116]|uniref:amidohydrolase family protein n=1 Tax=Streptomyces sp. VNUA116 TaxID=3062449 RepID=UPI0026756263|nr:amidohydrolase family protein [Streptomyces sp. VNUA116]WKU43293.1 amidohydrolase family protein [Streptomyces sp. VNUA116]